MLAPVEKAESRTPFFEDELLDATEIVILTDSRIETPDFYPMLSRIDEVGWMLPDFSTMSAITFGGVVVSHGTLSTEVLFHELVHAEQYRQLGISTFVEHYVRGLVRSGSYYRIPLELCAYELEKRFETGETPFSVSSEIRTWIAESRF